MDQTLLIIIEVLKVPSLDDKLKVIKQGKNAWDKWRSEQDPFETIEAIDLRGINLEKENLKGFDFTEVDLSGANFSGADLSNADFSNGLLHDACLNGAILCGARFDTTMGTKANFSGAKFRGAFLCSSYFPDANFCGADLMGANIHSVHFSGSDFSGANLEGLDFTNDDLDKVKFYNANLRKVSLCDFNFRGVNLSGADLSEANLEGTDFSDADLSKAKLDYANLSMTKLINTNFQYTTLSNCTVFGASVWNIKINSETIQINLRVTDINDPIVTVDNIEVAQFIYLLLNHKKIRDVINILSDKVVLILGRFTKGPGGQKEILDSIAQTLREHPFGFLPIIFDFNPPINKNTSETVKVLAGLSKFIIADLTNPKSTPYESLLAISNFKVPFIPLIMEPQKPFSMFEDLQHELYVLQPISFRSKDNLIMQFDKVISLALDACEKVRDSKNKRMPAPISIDML